MVNNGLHMGDVINSIRRHKILIVIVTILSAVAGALFYITGPKKYEGKTEFILRNPEYTDRSNIFTFDNRLMDYFANDDDIDRLIVMAGADIVQGKVIKNMHLAEAYKINQSDPKDWDRLGRKFGKNFNITRTEYKDLILTYLDVDPERAAMVANECVAVLDSAYSEYFTGLRTDVYNAVLEKVNDEDSAINALTDTLTRLREVYGIYDIISPARNNIMLSPMKDNGNKNFGHGVEIIQNYESLKDQLVGDRARQMTIVNQYKTGIRKDQLPMLKVVTYARTPVTPKGIGGLYTVLAAALIGLFFCIMLMSFSDRYFNNTNA